MTKIELHEFFVVKHVNLETVKILRGFPFDLTSAISRKRFQMGIWDPSRANVASFWTDESFLEVSKVGAQI